LISNVENNSKPIFQIGNKNFNNVKMLILNIIVKIKSLIRK
jgi:hypothetical protein